VLWLDPTKNDLFASVFTGTATKTESRSTPVENLPIRRPFRLTAVFASRFVEIYVNGRLRLTHVLTTTPADVATGNIFNGSAVTARVANLKYWAYPLTARQVGAQASTPVATATLMAK
jgi:hypothetical protein